MRVSKKAEILPTHHVIRSSRLYLQLLFWSVAGALIRQGLGTLTNYSNSYIHTHYVLYGTCLWANFTGCFTLALINNSDAAIWDYVIDGFTEKNKKLLPLYVGLTTGLCGSLSTFSTLMLETFVETSDLLTVDDIRLPNHGYGVMEFFSVIAVQIGVSICGFHLGMDVSSYFNNHKHWFNFLSPGDDKILETVTSILGIAAWIANLVLCCVLPNHYFWNETWSFMVVFAPFGCFLRYLLSNSFNGKHWFHTGTFLANSIACLFIATFTLLKHGLKNDGSFIVTSQLQINVLSGLVAGFCGSLSTTSTFINELVGYKENSHYRLTYFMASIIVGFGLIVLILGSYGWTNGLAT